jgi:hypothetical protein
MEERACEDDEQRRLDEQPPEALSVRMKQRDAIRLDDGPHDADEGGERTEGSE